MFISFLRTLTVYLLLIGAVRLSGKRQIGQMEPAEFVVTMLIANLAGIPLEDGDIPLLSGLVPIFTVLGAELTLSWLTLASPGLGRLLCGGPVILIDDGEVLQNNLRKTRISLEELLSRLRQKDVLSIADVQLAILETDGSISVFPWPGKRPPTAEEVGIPTEKQSLPEIYIRDGVLARPDLPPKAMALLKGRPAEEILLLTVDRQGRVVSIPRSRP